MKRFMENRKLFKAGQYGDLKSTFPQAGPAVPWPATVVVVAEQGDAEGGSPLTAWAGLAF